VVFFCSQVRFSEDIGEIYKVRLGFDDDVDAEQNWLLDTVKEIQFELFLMLHCGDCFQRVNRKKVTSGSRHIGLRPFEIMQ